MKKTEGGREGGNRSYLAPKTATQTLARPIQQERCTFYEHMDSWHMQSRGTAGHGTTLALFVVNSVK